jgi:hypothetical protein
MSITFVKKYALIFCNTINWKNFMDKYNNKLILFQKNEKWEEKFLDGNINYSIFKYPIIDSLNSCDILYISNESINWENFPKITSDNNINESSIIVKAKSLLDRIADFKNSGSNKKIIELEDEEYIIKNERKILIEKKMKEEEMKNGEMIITKYLEDNKNKIKNLLDKLDFSI